MINGIRTSNPRGFNKGRSSKFRVGSRVQQTSCGNNNNDEDNSPKTFNDRKILNSTLNLRDRVTFERTTELEILPISAGTIMSICIAP